MYDAVIEGRGLTGQSPKKLFSVWVPQLMSLHWSSFSSFESICDAVGASDVVISE